MHSMKKIIFWAVLIYLLQLSIAAYILYFLGSTQLNKSLEKKTQRISEDLTYKNGTWDLDSYNNDPKLLGSYPLYLITQDGFVLDRRSTIHGFLDSSDYKRLLNYQKVQTISSVTGYTRRIYSRVIADKGKDLAVITVSYFNPKEEVLSLIDKELIQNADIIYSQLSIKNGTLDVSKIDQRKISYDTSYIIVDKYNTILSKTTNVNNIGRIPNFIDPSYVKNELNNISTRIISDNESDEKFIVISKPILDKDNAVLGIMIVGTSYNNFYNLLREFSVWYSLFSLVLFLITLFLLNNYFKRALRQNAKLSKLENLYFDDKQGKLIIDDKKISIPYATNQYYMLKTLFSNPNKRWETDELLDKFGELKGEEGARKIYDTMVNINRKVAGYLEDKLIITQNKTFQLNSGLPVKKTSK